MRRNLEERDRWEGGGDTGYLWGTFASVEIPLVKHFFSIQFTSAACTTEHLQSRARYPSLNVMQFNENRVASEHHPMR
jgi:hypothetical protein